MQNTDKKTFDAKTQQWIEAQKPPWSRLRYELAFTYLQPFLKTNSLNILDAGGGNGLDSLPLAKLGNKITLLDYSTEMLAAAKADTQKEQLTDNYTYVEDTVFNIDKHFKGNTFDVVLLHNILSYVDKPLEVMQQAISVLKPGGIFSLMQVNKYSEVYYPAVFENNLDKSLEKLDANVTQANMFNVTIQRFSAEELIEMVGTLGLKLIERFGISALNTFISNNELKSDKVFYDKLKKLEIMMAQRFPYYHVARFNHLIFKK